MGIKWDLKIKCLDLGIGSDLGYGKKCLDPEISSDPGDGNKM